MRSALHGTNPEPVGELLVGVDCWLRRLRTHRVGLSRCWWENKIERIQPIQLVNEFRAIMVAAILFFKYRNYCPSVRIRVEDLELIGGRERAYVFPGTPDEEAQVGQECVKCYSQHENCWHDGEVFWPDWFSLV